MLYFVADGPASAAPSMRAVIMEEVVFILGGEGVRALRC
jgi:hypothetical protein